MKALIIPKRTVQFLFMLLLLSAMLVSTQAQAHSWYKYKHHWHKKAAIAICYVATTGALLPTHQCCSLRYKHNGKWHTVWSNKWVPWSCGYAGASASRGCDETSFVYNTNSPILGSC